MTPDLDAALAAVRAHEPAITLGNPGVVERGDEIWIYLEHPPRSSIADGEIYTTYIVRMRAGTAIHLTHVRSRRGANGDSTLPP